MRKEDFIDWRESQVTEEVFSMIEDRINMLKEELASGSTLWDKTNEQTAKIVGMIAGLRTLTEIEYEGEDNV